MLFPQIAVFFHLYTSLAAESVKVMTSDNLTIQLDRVYTGHKHYWINRQPFYLPNDQRVCRYHYIATFKKGLLARAYHWVRGTGEGSSESIFEKKFRTLNTGTNQYDIFRFPSNKESDRDLFAGYFFFVRVLCSKLPVGGGNCFPQILIECENLRLGFSWIDKADTVTFLKWIEDVTSKPITWHHVVFICCILGRFMQLRNYNEVFHSMYSRTADRLLRLLTGCEYDHIPRSSVEMIKSIATCLLQAGSCKGGLAFLSYFANLFEVDRLLQIADKLPMQYSDQDFNSFAGYVVDLLVSLAEVSDSREICDFLVDNCNSIGCLWHLYRELSVRLPDLTNSLGERFSERFLKLIAGRTRAQKIDLLQQNYWEMTPIAMRKRLADLFVKALHQQVAHDTLSQETLVTLKSYTADKDICASKCFVPLILCLAQNRNEGVIKAVMDMLNSKRFFEVWNSWSDTEKAEICNSLLKTMFQFQNPFRRIRQREKVVQVLEAEKKICETYALQNDQKTKLELEKCVIKLLQNVSINSILDAFVDTDSSSQMMQSCYSSLLRDAIKRSGTSGDTSQIKTLLHLLDVKKKDDQNESVEFEG